MPRKQRKGGPKDRQSTVPDNNQPHLPSKVSSAPQNSRKASTGHTQQHKGPRHTRSQPAIDEQVDSTAAEPASNNTKQGRYNLRSSARRPAEIRNSPAETQERVDESPLNLPQEQTKRDYPRGEATISVLHWVDRLNNESALDDVSADHLPPTFGTPYSALAYRSHGYDPTDEEMASTEITASVAESQTVKDVDGKPQRTTCLDARHTDFYGALRERNVDFKRSDDGEKDEILKTIHQKRDSAPTEEDERHWEADLAKCESSDEAVFQRTIMMDLLDRHRLEGPLDYACESIWKCVRMPRKMAKGAREMARPKPDLAVSFKSSAIISTFAFSDLGSFKGAMCPEAFKEGKDDRAFPFFAVEVKGSQGEVGNTTAIRQNFNTASQALHNIFRFMKAAGQEEIFYKKVRFYSAIATSAGFQLRVHRAVELKENRIEPDYPLGFMFDEVFRSTSDRYSKTEVSGIVKNILFEYGVKTLLPILKKAAAHVLRAQSLKQSSRKRTMDDSFSESFTSSQRVRMDNLRVNEVSPQAA